MAASPTGMAQVAESGPRLTTPCSARLLPAPAASVTRNVTSLTPSALGVPLIAPVVAFSARPAGRLPATTDHANGFTPFNAASVVEYGRLSLAIGSAVVVIVTCGAIATELLTLTAEPALSAIRVMKLLV